MLARLAAHDERLLLVGHMTPGGLPPMPEELKPYVKVLPDLRFRAYYDTLASCRAILTAFGSGARRGGAGA